MKSPFGDKFWDKTLEFIYLSKNKITCEFLLVVLSVLVHCGMCRSFCVLEKKSCEVSIILC
jgi:uncharacterized protein (UPF0333 family)